MNLNGWEIPIIILAILILFGGKNTRIYEWVGKRYSQFQKGLNDIEEEIKSDLNDDKPSSSDEN